MDTADRVEEVVAAVDIGTNSVHLVVARMAGAHAFDVLAREKEMVRLGSGGGDMAHLADDAVDRAVAALSRFRRVAEAHGAGDVVAVATSAVREAENRSVFVERARVEAGVDVQIVSGAEEARLIHLGVLQAVPAYDRRLLLCDIGGGSTELLVGERSDVVAVRSMKLGAIRLAERFLSAPELTGAAVEACRRHAREVLAPFGRTLRDLDVEVGIGSSGTIGALCAMAAARGDGTAPRTLNNFVLTRSDLADVIAALVAAPTAEERAEIPGLDPRRADIIVAGALICEQVMDVGRLDALTYSDYALREGVLLDVWQRRQGASLHHLSDLRRRSVVRLADVMDEDPAHSAHVARLALELFDQLRARHGLGEEAREHLEVAALLSNVGLFVSHAAHHKHSYYVIRHSDRLAGFTDSEIELIALIARYHRKSSPKARHPEFAAIGADGQRTVRICAGLLRLAIGLDRSHAGNVAGVQVAESAEGDRLRVLAVPAAGADIELELFSAEQRRGLAEEALGLPVEVARAG